MKTLTVKSLSDLPEAAAELLEAAAGRRVVALYGDMGAGKTTLVKEVCRACGTKQPAVSPTFSIVNVYDTSSGSPVYHFDFYRIRSIEEAFDFGYEEYFFSGALCLVEWPEMIEELLPEDALRVYIAVLDDGSRRIDIE